MKNRNHIHLSLIHISEPTRHYSANLVCRLLLEKKKQQKNTKKNKNKKQIKITKKVKK